MYCRNVATDRALTADEKELLRVLMAKGKPEAYRFIPQIEDVRVKIECACGCARIGFLDKKSESVMVLAHQSFAHSEGSSSQLYVYAVGERLGGLDIMFYDKMGDPKQLWDGSVYSVDPEE